MLSTARACKYRVRWLSATPFGRTRAAAGIEKLGDGVFVDAENTPSERSGLALIEQIFVSQIGGWAFFVQGDEELDAGASGPEFQLFHQRREVVFE